MKDSKVYLIHIQDCIQRIESYTAEGESAFLQDRRTQDAVIRNLEVICESTKNLRDEWKANHSNIDWKRMRDFRNFLAHQYLDVDLDVVWKVIEKYIPALKIAINKMRNELEEAG